MAGRLEFKEKLGDILKEAIAQGGDCLLYTSRCV